ncbi:MAG: type II CAAX endopeptidase family protein [Caldilineaceae bacterium]
MQYEIKFTLYPIHIAIIYLGFLTAAELITALVDPWVGISFHAVLLAVMLLHTAVTWHDPSRRFLISLTFAPMIRILSLSLPLATFPLVYWFLITSIPLFIALLLIVRTLEFSADYVGLNMRRGLVQLLIMPTGLLFGVVEYYILKPEPLISPFNWGGIVVAALILLVSTGFFEEIAFRGIMQTTALETLGRFGLVYIALIFAVLHIGYQSLIDVIFVFGVGLFFGWVVKKTGSIAGVTVSHGITNSVLFLVMPFVVAAGSPVEQQAVALAQSESIALNAPIDAGQAAFIATATPQRDAATAKPMLAIVQTTTQTSTATVVATATAASTATALPITTATVAPAQTTFTASTFTPAPTATWTVTPLPPFSALLPKDGAAAKGALVFEWQTDRVLAADQRYEVVFWQPGQDALRDGVGYAVRENSTRVQINLRELDFVMGAQFEPGEYLWGVLLVQKEPNYRRLEYLGGGNRIVYEY